MSEKEIVRRKPEGEVRITTLPDSRNRLVLRPSNAALYVESYECETSFPLELIEYIIEKAPFVSLCSWIGRYEIGRASCRERV